MHYSFYPRSEVRTVTRPRSEVRTVTRNDFALEFVSRSTGVLIQDPKSDLWHEMLPCSCFQDPLDWFPRSEVRIDEIILHWMFSIEYWSKIRSRNCDTKWFCTGVFTRSEVRTMTRNDFVLNPASSLLIRCILYLYLNQYIYVRIISTATSIYL